VPEAIARTQSADERTREFVTENRHTHNNASAEELAEARRYAIEVAWAPEDADSNVAAAYVGPRDMDQLLVRAIETPAITYAVVADISNNRRKRYDLHQPQALPAYTPQGDGFRA
jgi:hypothetical protein